jgi:hypothetical protein
MKENEWYPVQEGKDNLPPLALAASVASRIFEQCGMGDYVTVVIAVKPGNTKVVCDAKETCIVLALEEARDGLDQAIDTWKNKMANRN